MLPLAFQNPAYEVERQQRDAAMKKSIPIVLLLLIGISALARAFLPWTEAKMQEASDLILVGTVTKVQDLDETNTRLWPHWKFRGVEATVVVSKVLKGDPATRTIVLHYYRFDTERGVPLNGPSFLNLTSTDTNRFLLYLVRDGARFAPVSGSLIHQWMQSEYFVQNECFTTVA